MSKSDRSSARRRAADAANAAKTLVTRVVGHVRSKGYAKKLTRTLKHIPQRYPGLGRTWHDLRHAFAMEPESAAKADGRATRTRTKKSTKKKTTAKKTTRKKTATAKKAGKKKTATGSKKTSTRKTGAKKKKTTARKSASRRAA